MKKITILSLFLALSLNSGLCFGRNQDGTGPNGQGPQTGRGLGPCNPNNNGNTPKVWGQGLGPKFDGTGPRANIYGRGRGRNCGCGFRCFWN